MGTTPAIETILTEIGLRMGNITVARGYWSDAKKITLAQLTPFKGYDLPSINYWATQTINTKDSYGNDEREVRLFIEMHASTRDLPFITVVGRLESDIVTALNRLPAATAGSSKSGDLPITDMVGNSADRLKISVDGDAAEEIECDWTSASTGTLIAAQMQIKIRALGGNKATVTATFFNGRYIITSSTTGVSSSVVITPGATDDCTTFLNVGVLCNGVESSGLAAAPAVSDSENLNLNDTIKDLAFDGCDYEVGEGQEPWCGVLVKFGVVYLASSFNMYTHFKE